MTPEEKASRLRALMGDPVFVEAVEKVRENIRIGWENCKDPVERDMLWHRQAALADLLNGLNAMQQDIRYEAFRFAKIVSRN